MPLFEVPQTGAQAPNPALELLTSIDPNTLSPKDALDLIFRLKDISQ